MSVPFETACKLASGWPRLPHAAEAQPLSILPAESALIAATTWLEQLLTGSFAMAVAILAVAGIGFRMLTGELELRRALQVLVGIFILFGAPTIVRELATAVRSDRIDAAYLPPSPDLPPPAAPKMPPAVDPYAGAAVPGD